MHKKEKKLIRAGMSRIDSELKLDKMMKSIIKIRIAISTIFTRKERFLLKNNRAFVLHSDQDSDPSLKTKI